MRQLPDLGALDGFVFLKVIEETSTTLRAIGSSHFVPSGVLPIDAEFLVVGSAIKYRVLIGCDDETWDTLTEAKRWKAVYFWAHEGSEPAWNWDQPIEGILEI